MKFVIAYIVIINLIGFMIMGVDKKKARIGAWRIPEKVLFGTALLGGGLGAWIGMYVFRHKTKHWYFKYGLPVIFIVELLVSLWLLVSQF